VIRQAAIQQLAARYGGRAREEAYLEFAQEHFLDWCRAERLFDDDCLVFKGGTAIRKFVLGDQGRFSTDLDFSVADWTFADHILEQLRGDGITHQGVRIWVVREDTEARKAVWRAEADGIGAPTIEASIEFTTRPLMLAPSPLQRAPIFGVDARWLGFPPASPPVADLVETIAEKLARFRRQAKGRDVYDLALIAPRMRDRLGVLREVFAFKVYFDEVEDGLHGPVPFVGGAHVVGRRGQDIIGGDDLGLLTAGAPPLDQLLRTIEIEYERMGPPQGEIEIALAACNPRDHFRARQWFAERSAALRESPVGR
jgi:predicted nucleotidyltransferase component of viral defense system